MPLTTCRSKDRRRDSHLRPATADNPRNLPCPTCLTPNLLTPTDRERHFQCDACADQDELDANGRGR